MKKVTITLSLMFALFLWAFTAQAVTVQIGTGTTTNTSVPIFSCYDYSYTQQIYLASEIGDGGGGSGPITKIRFFYATGGTDLGKWNDWTIYLGNTAKDVFASTTDWVPLSGLTQVFSGTIPAQVAGTWLEFTLPASFDYTGGNLVVAVDENAAGYSCSAAWRSYTASTNRAIFCRLDGTNPDPASPPTANSITTTLSQVQFEMAAFVPTLPPTCALLTSPANEAIDVAAKVSLQWANGGGFPAGYSLFLGTDNPPTNLVNGTDLGNVTTFTPAAPLAYSTTYYWQVVAYNVVGPATGCDVWSFTTLADPVITSLPYVQSFDAPAFPPLGWTNIKVSGGGTPGIWDRQTSGFSPTCSPHSGAAMARYNSYNLSQLTTGALITPQVNVADPVVQIKFWMYRDNAYLSTPDRVEVYTNTSESVVGATLLGTVNRPYSMAPAEAAMGWYEYTFNFNNSGKGIFYVILQGVSGAGNNIFVDDFSLILPPACPKPTALTATNITGTTALLGWTEMGTAASWNIEVGSTGFTPTGVPTASGVANPYLLTGLTAGASYAYYVQADCGGEYSDWTGPLTFTTKVVAPVPYFEGFATAATPAGWLTTGWIIGSGRGATGNPGNNIYKNLYTATPGTFTIVSIGSIAAEMRLTFDYKTSNYSSPYAPPVAGSGNFVVSISTDYGTTYTVIDTQPNDGIAGWHSKSYDLSVYAGNDIKIQITANRTSGDYDLAFDNFKVETPPACMPPSALTATDITTSSAMLSWTENGTATSWNIEFGEAGFTPSGTATYSGVTNPYLVEGLMDYTAYAFYVQADCDAKALSTWVGPFTFKTLALPFTVPFFDGFEVGNTHNTAVERWTQEAVTGSGVWTANNTLTTYNRTPKTGGWNAFLQYGNERWMFIAIDLTGGAKYAFSMFARQDETSGATVTVSYGAAGNDAAMVNPIIAETNISNGDYQQLSSVFTPATDGVYYIGIKGYLNYTPWYLSIDDISIEEAPAPGYISGVVTDAVTGDPLEGVTVTAMPVGTTDITDAFGNYSLELDLGMYELTFELPDYYQTTISGVPVESGLTTVQNATLAPVPPPDCSELVFPPDNLGGVLPYEPLQWELPEGSAEATGYRLLLYNITDDIWLVDDQVNGDDIGNVTEYLPAGGWGWGKDYVWLIYPYNNAGAPEECIPWYFTTPFTGIFEGMVTEAVTGLPLGDVTVKLEEILPHEGLTFEVTTAADGSWTFEFESGIYNIVYEKYGYETLSTPLQTLQTLQTVALAVQMVPEIQYQLPFIETWSSGSYGTQKWTRTSPSNWALVLDGNPGPSAIFSWDPIRYDYDMLLQSHFIDATNETEVYVQFDLLLDSYTIYSNETMQFEVFDGTVWHVVDVIDNSGGDIPWQTNTYDITNLVAGGLFQIGFRAVGESSSAIDWWLLDNIIVTNNLFEVQPESIHDILFAGETIDYDIDLKNFGLGGIGWNAQIVPANAAMSLSKISGTLMPGTETIILTLDADAIAPGVYESEVIITGANGIFVKSVLVHFEVTDQAGQKIMIPEAGQWGYISTYIDMNAKMSVDVVMADIADDMVIMLGKTGIFWPAFNINTIGEYDTYQGYKLKMANDAALAFYGYPVQNKTVSFNTGTHIVPVLSQTPILAATVFGGQPIEFAFGLDGTIYWPAGNIYTLEELVPGFGYLVRFNAPATLDFNVAKSSSLAFNKPASRVNYTTWNDVNYTGDVHIIGISAEATAELLPGDVVGIFDANGQCTGMALYNGDNKAFALVAYADDPTTIATDGMLDGETLQVKIFRDNETIDAQPVYNKNMPEYSGNYVINGLTMISSFKAGATSIGDVTTTTFAVYPNPTTGIITIDGITSTTKVMVTNTQGQIISNISIEAAHQLDLSSQPSGLYFVKLVSDQGTKTIKLVVR